MITVSLFSCCTGMIFLTMLKTCHMANFSTHSHNGVCLFNLEGKIL